MNRLNLKSLLLLLVMLCMSLNSMAYNFVVDGIYYTKSQYYDSTAGTYRTGVNVAPKVESSSNVTTYSGEVIIPESVIYDGISYRVKGIASWAFCYCSDLTSITIPNTVTSIGLNAFRGCSGLTSITIPNSVTSIGENAFYNCTSLTSLSIPNSVTSIEQYAFQGCSSLQKVEFASIESLCAISFGGYYSNPLEYTNSLYIDGREIKDLIIPNTVTSINGMAFWRCSGLTSITIPNSVTNIGHDAFFACM